MSSTLQPEPLPLSRLLSRPVLISGAAVVAAMALAWAWLLSSASSIDAQGGMGGMPMFGMMQAPDPWSVNYLLAAFTMWALMMVAMMLPSAAPMILLHARIDRGTQAERIRDSLLFVACYLAVWTTFSALATFAQSALINWGLLSSVGLTLSSRWITAGLLMAVAAWQLTSAKTACLEQCRSPLQFIMHYWRPGAAGAVRLGFKHGLFCLGCCWALMLLLFVGGVMNLAWVAALATIVFGEKVTPRAWQADRWLAGLLMLVACVLMVL